MLIGNFSNAFDMSINKMCDECGNYHPNKTCEKYSEDLEKAKSLIAKE